MPKLTTYKLIEAISEVHEWTVELPEGATEQQIKDAAYKTRPRIKFSEVEETEITGPVAQETTDA